MKESDQWQTPQWLFDELNEEFNFQYDCCAEEHNTKCVNWSSNFLEDDEVVFCESAFMNPPYSNPLPFVSAAWERSKHCKIVCLLKVDTSTRWWSVFWDYGNHTPKDGCEVRFFPRRIKFESPNKEERSGPTFPSCLVIMDRRKLNGID